MPPDIDKTTRILYTVHYTIYSKETRAVKNLILYTVLAAMLTGCAGTELIVRTTEYDNWYITNCATANSRYRPGDPQCTSRGEPQSQYGQIQRRPKESELSDLELLIRARHQHCGGPCQPLKY
jgi:hypothetical protein